MARRIGTGRVGRQVLGSLSTEDNTLQSIVPNSNIVLEPNGTGIVESTAHVSVADTKELRFSEGGNYIALKAPALTGDVTLTLPTDNGAANQILKTDGNGVLDFVDTSLPVQNRSLADNSPYYVAMTSGTSGNETTLSVADSNRLQFVPNPGTLTVYNVSVGNDVTVTADLSAATITETSSIVYKENVNPITGALDAILNLQGVTYDRKGTHHKGEAGLIAEEVADVIPNIVTFKDGKPEGINYTKLTAYLIEAVKTLKEELDKVKK